MNLIKKGHILFLTALLTLCFVSCDNDDDDDDELGNWVEKSSYDGVNRSSAVSFTIGTKGYAGTGYDGDDQLGDFFEYDSETNKWTGVQTIGLNNDDSENTKVDAKPRQGAVAFSIGNKGYVGTGYDGENELSDFWEFDPTVDKEKGKQWKKIADFGTSGLDEVGLKRRGAVGFSLNGKGYVGTGYDGSARKDFWEYDPETNAWTEIGFIGNKRQDATVFVIKNEGKDIAYIGTGLNNGGFEEDFYSFDGTTFTKLTDLDDEDEDNEILLYNGVGFSINGKGYITTGVSSSTSKTTWEYTPETDTWDEVTEFEERARQSASAFTFDSTAYVFLGQNGSYFDDVFEFKPDELKNEDD